MSVANSPVAVVTGGARRIGRAIVEHLHDRGFAIALHYHNSVDSAQALATQLCKQRTGSCQLFRADLQDPAQVSALAAEILAQYTDINLLVNNASGFAPTPIESCSPAQFDRLLDTNLRAPYFLIQGLLAGMRQGGASIVNILDVYVDRPLRHYNAYGAAKAGLASLTRSLAVELGPTIRVNGVAPGAILWPQDDEAFDSAARDAIVARTPLQTLGDPTDIARAVGFLACDAPFVSGQIITVDGGRSLVD
ncbi:MAG: pteridine reductase [Halioglobus sp.]